MVSKIYFKNYKAFNAETVMEIKPITLLLGKNSSGKTSLTKLVSMLSSATRCEGGNLLLLKNESGVRFANRYEDLFYRNLTTDMQLGVEYENGTTIKCSYLMNNGNLYLGNYQIISSAVNKTIQFFGEEPSQSIKGIFHMPTFENLHLDSSILTFKVNYIGPIRKQLEASFSYSGGTAKTSVGIDGEKTQELLLDSYKAEDKLFPAVSAWFEANLEGQKLTMESNGPSSGTYSLYVNRNGAKVNVVDVGQGLTQVLPIVVESFLPKTSDIEIIEQPALHLHPAAHSYIAERLVDSALELNKKYIIESHSKNFLLGLRNKVASGKLSENDIIIYFIDTDDEGSYLKPIHINQDGSLDNWPTGVFEEDYELLTDILDKQK